MAKKDWTGFYWAKKKKEKAAEEGVNKFFLAGLNLRAWREKTLNMTQRDLAKNLGDMNSQFVSNWERGLCMPPKHAMPKILDKMQPAERSVLREALASDLITYYWGSI